MKLLLKLPPLKPPFIGIIFSHRGDAEQTHQDMVTVNPHFEYRMVLEFANGLLNMKLISGNMQVTKLYEGISFDSEQLIYWINQTKNMNSFNFGHLYELNGKEVVAKTSIGLKLFVVRVNVVQVMDPDKHL
jgi:hypothetical protein